MGISFSIPSIIPRPARRIGTKTISATANAVLLSGAKPVLVDIEPNFYSIDLSKLESAITEKTKAIILVHLYGCPAEIENIKKITTKHNIFLIEDCAQAHGAVYKDRKVKEKLTTKLQ